MVNSNDINKHCTKFELSTTNILRDIHNHHICAVFVATSQKQKHVGQVQIGTFIPNTLNDNDA